MPTITSTNDHDTHGTIISTRTHTAAKLHICDNCGGDIIPGQEYHIVAYKVEGEFYTFKSHIPYDYTWVSCEEWMFSYSGDDSWTL